MMNISVLPLIIGIVLFLWSSVRLFIKVYNKDIHKQVKVYKIIVFGAIGFVLSLISAFISFAIDMAVIADGGDIQTSLFVNGLKGAIGYIISGVSVFIISLIVWGVLKTVKKNLNLN
jgi:hypothetical protein